MSEGKTFVGFGFGAIQAGLFIYEAHRSGRFSRLVLAEVLGEVVDAVRANGGFYGLNIARPDGIERTDVGPIEIYRPNDPEDRERLIDAMGDANEAATAVPSVTFYRSRGPGSIHRIIARGLEGRGPRPVAIYAAENHNEAAEILRSAVEEEISPPLEGEARFRFLNTVIAKMSGVVTDEGRITEMDLRRIAPGSKRAFLVEEFNRILVSEVGLEDFERGIETFIEKPDLIPFEEAKLYGHNATHALLAYLGDLAGIATTAQARSVPGLVELGREALIEESGRALVKKYAGIDPLFTPEGYREFADDLIARILNPHLRDTVERVGRDPERKLGWDDRIIGTIRLCESQGIRARRYALAGAAALVRLRPELRRGGDGREVLGEIWGESVPDGEERTTVEAAVARGLEDLQAWIREGRPDLSAFMRRRG